MKLIENVVTYREKTKETGGLTRGLAPEARGKASCFLRCAALMILSLLLFLPSNVSLADEIPPHVLAVIKQKAAREFPGDENLRLLTIERQSKAYQEVRHYSNTRIPENILNRIKKRATFESPGNYCAQQYLLESQSRDYLYLKDYMPKDVSHQAFIEIMQNAELEYPDDFSTRRLIVNAKVAKYRDLEKLSGLGGEAHVTEKTAISTKTVPDAAPQIMQADIQTSEAIPEDAKEAAEKTAMKKRYHEIKRGENLYRISLRYGLSLQELCHINGINQQDVIRPGQKLLVTP